MSTIKRILALDVGRKRVGVALSDPLGLTAQGAGVIPRHPERELFAAIAARAKEADVKDIVVGFPLTLKGEAGAAAQEVTGFAQKLRKEVGLSVILWDERLSTAQAERVLLAADVSRRKRRGAIDAVAAAIILQSYLDAKR